MTTLLDKVARTLKNELKNNHKSPLKKRGKNVAKCKDTSKEKGGYRL